MKDLTHHQMRERIAEIAQLQSEHDARDFDAELRDALESGADVDQLEEQHLQAERISRRLRVERQALEAALPDAARRDAEQEIEALAKGCTDHAEEYRSAATKLTAVLTEAEQLRGILDGIDKKRAQLHAHAEQLGKTHHLSGSVTAPFYRLKSGRLEALISEQQKRAVTGHSVSLGYISSTKDVDHISAADAA